MAENEIIDAPCRRCMNPTRHDVLAVKSVDDAVERDDGWDLISRTTFSMVQCRGCEAVSLVEREDYPAYQGNVRAYYYPPPLARRIPQWHYLLAARDGEMRKLLEEVYSALRADTRRLALMGVRAIVDMLLLSAA